MRRITLLALMIARLAAQQAPTASIEGTVTDDVTNEPVKKAQVKLIGPGAQSTAVTDGLGRFAFRDLPAGAYLVQATRDGYDEARAIEFDESGRQLQVAADQHVSGADLRLVPSGSISGHLADEQGNAARGCDVSAVAAWNPKSGAPRRNRESWGEHSDDHGDYRISELPSGRYFVYEHCRQPLPTAHGFIERGDPRTPSLIYAPGFFGGAPGSEGASAVIVRSGAETRGIDFRLKVVNAIRVYASVTSDQPAGDPRDMTVLVSPRDQRMGRLGSYQLSFVPKDGVFTRLVAPGAYVVKAYSENDDDRFYGEAPLDAGEASPVTLMIPLTRAPAVNGSIGFREKQATQFPRGAQVTLRPLDNEWDIDPLPQARLSPGGSFYVSGIVPGQWQIEVKGIPGSIESATIAGREILPWAFDVSPTTRGTLHVVMSTTRVPLNVTVSGGENAHEISVIAMPASGDPTQAQIVRAQGGVAAMSVPPGDYAVYAIESGGAAAIRQDAPLLAALAGQSRSVTVKDDGANVALELITRDDLKHAFEQESR